jgi:hypothetical protein
VLYEQLRGEWHARKRAIRCAYPRKYRLLASPIAREVHSRPDDLSRVSSLGKFLATGQRSRRWRFKRRLHNSHKIVIDLFTWNDIVALADVPSASSNR